MVGLKCALPKVLKFAAENPKWKMLEMLLFFKLKLASGPATGEPLLLSIVIPTPCLL